MGLIIKNGKGWFSNGNSITAQEYSTSLAQLKEKADLVDRLSAGSISLSDIPEGWRDEISARAQSRREEAQENAQEATTEDYQAALAEMGVNLDGD